MTSITDIDNLVSELQEARNYLQSEGERIRAEIARYIGPYRGRFGVGKDHL